jgi:hypothetical protein
MSEREGGTTLTICEIAGCTGHATASRWIVTEVDGRRQIEVCWKHEEGDIDPDLVKPR